MTIPIDGCGFVIQSVGLLLMAGAIKLALFADTDLATSDRCHAVTMASVGVALVVISMSEAIP